MKKLIRNSLIASVVAVAGATGFAGEAKAQLGPNASSQPSDVEVNFTGEVGNLCEITKIKDGKMELADTLGNDKILSSRPDESSKGEFAEVRVNCNAGGEISVSTLTPDSADANTLAGGTNFVSNAFVAENPNDFDDGTELAKGEEGTTSQITLNGTAKTLLVHGVAISNSAVPAGSYAFKATVTIAPQ